MRILTSTLDLFADLVLYPDWQTDAEYSKNYLYPHIQSMTIRRCSNDYIVRAYRQNSLSEQQCEMGRTEAEFQSTLPVWRATAGQSDGLER